MAQFREMQKFTNFSENSFLNSRKNKKLSNTLVTVKFSEYKLNKSPQSTFGERKLNFSGDYEKNRLQNAECKLSHGRNAKHFYEIMSS